MESGLGIGLGRTWSVNINGINYISTNRTIIFTGSKRYKDMKDVKNALIHCANRDYGYTRVSNA